MASRQAAIAPSLIPLTFILDSSYDNGTAGIKLLLQPPILLFLLCQTLRKQATLVMLSFAYIRSHSYILHPVLPSPNRCRDLFLLLLAFVVGIGVTLALKLPTKWQWLGIGAVALLYALPVIWLYWLVFTLSGKSIGSRRRRPPPAARHVRPLSSLREPVGRAVGETVCPDPGTWSNVVMVTTSRWR